MFKAIRSLFRATPDAPRPAIPPGKRVYAVGDVHGRLDLLVPLAEAIEADNAAREKADSTVILLGDLIDRGPDSAGVIAAARMWAKQRPVRILMGNHEEMLLDSLTDVEVLKQFIRHGGRETALSYGIAPEAYTAAEIDELQAMLVSAVPPEDIAFIEGFEDAVGIGGYLFVHAGVMPELTMADQRPAHLRWIREPFLSYAGDHGRMVVHGHTVTEEPDLRANRIGIDTGAYESGRLTALCLEGEARWLIETRDEGGNISVAMRDV